MNLRKNMTISFTLAALALGMTTTIASAQTGLKGSFELPEATYFGNTLLEPGQYTIWMSTEARDIVSTSAIHISGAGVTKTFLAISRPTRESGSNCLKITPVDGAVRRGAFSCCSVTKIQMQPPGTY